MQHRTSFLACMPLACAVFFSAFLTAGCGDGPDRKASKDLREATALARRVYGHAHAIYSNPPLAPEATDLPPEVLTLLDEARQSLESALSETYGGPNGDATGDDAALARLTLGRIYQLRGRYFFWSASKAGQRAQEYRRNAVDRLDVLAEESTALAHLNELVSLSSEELVQLRSQAESEVDAAKQEMTNVQSRIDTLEAEKKKTQAEIASLTSTATELRAASALDPSEEGLAKLDKALAARTEALSKELRVQEIDQELLRLNAERKRAEIAQTQAQARVERATEVLASQAKDKQTITAKVKDTLSAVKELSERAGSEIEAAGTELGKAHALYVDAEAMFQKAQATYAEAIQDDNTPKSRLSALYSEQAGSYSLIGSVQMRESALYDAFDSLNGRIDTTWQMLGEKAPARPDAPGITKFLESAGPAAKAAVVAYEKAANAYLSAVDHAPDQAVWQFQRPRAAALLALAQAAMNADDLARAKKAIDKAASVVSVVRAAADDVGDPDAIILLSNSYNRTKELYDERVAGSAG